MVVLGHIGVEQLDPHGIAFVVRPARSTKPRRSPGDALVRDRSRASNHAGARRGPCRAEARDGVPRRACAPRCPVSHAPFATISATLGCCARISTVSSVLGIVIGDDRIDMAGEIFERIGQKQRFVADARECDEDMLSAEQRLVAGDDPLAVAEPPAHGQGPTGANTVCASSTPLSENAPSLRNSCSDRRLWNVSDSSRPSPNSPHRSAMRAARFTSRPITV